MDIAPKPSTDDNKKTVCWISSSWH